MKTKILLLILITMFTFSCDDENSQNENIELTDNNYIYEGDLYKQYLNDELAIVENEITQLQEIIDNGQGDNQTQIDLDEAIQERENIITNIDSIISLVTFGIIPPPPPPQPCSCFTPELQYFITLESTSGLQIDILNEGGEQIASTNQILNFLPNYDNQLKYKTISIPEEYGNVSFQVVKTDNQNNTINYVTDGVLEQ